MLHANHYANWRGGNVELNIRSPLFRAYIVRAIKRSNYLSIMNYHKERSAVVMKGVGVHTEMFLEQVAPELKS